MKDINSHGRLWGWSDPKEEREYVSKAAEDMRKKYDSSPAGSFKEPYIYSQSITYPVEGLSCIQIELWIDETGGKVLDDNAMMKITLPSPLEMIQKAMCDMREEGQCTTDNFSQ